MVSQLPEHSDVVVVGGGPAGYPAAIQAARLGASTLLVEKNGALGGTTTVAGVALPGLFHAWGQQVIAGIGCDVVRRSVEVVGRELPDFSDWDQPHYLLQVPVIPAIYAATIDEAIRDSGVDLTLHTMLAEVIPEADRWTVTLAARQALLLVFRFLVRQPGLERLTVDQWAVEGGIRETFTIDGWSTSPPRTTRAAASGPTPSATASIPSTSTVPAATASISARFSTARCPRGAMLPRGAERLVVAGKAVSGDQEANSADRVQASCMAMGQAAGALAALTAQSGIAVDALAIEDVRAVPSQHGAIVPGDVHVPPQRDRDHITVLREDTTVMGNPGSDCGRTERRFRSAAGSPRPSSVEVVWVAAMKRLTGRPNEEVRI